MPRLSYIPWHDDGSRGERRAVTIYLNEYWDQNWGGCFAFQSNNEINCVQPKYNIGLVVDSGVYHSVFSTTMDAPIRESVQLFELRSNEMGNNGS